MAPLAGPSPVGSAQAALLVSLGAIPGAWLRYRIVNHLEPMLPRKHWGTLLVNLVACFALGLLVGLVESCGAGGQRLLLLLATGFLGSLSTFSSFVGEVLVASRSGHRRQVLVLVGGSLGGGLLAVVLGLALATGP